LPTVEELYERLVKTSRALYAKGVDVASETRILAESGERAVHNAEVCYQSAVLFDIPAKMKARHDVVDKIYRGFSEGKITAHEGGEALITITDVDSEYSKMFLENLGKCGCKFR